MISANYTGSCIYLIGNRSWLQEAFDGDKNLMLTALDCKLHAMVWKLAYSKPPLNIRYSKTDKQFMFILQASGKCSTPTGISQTAGKMELFIHLF